MTGLVSVKTRGKMMTLKGEFVCCRCTHGGAMMTVSWGMSAQVMRHRHPTLSRYVILPVCTLMLTLNTVSV